jgi:hypothetical protein
MEPQRLRAGHSTWPGNSQKVKGKHLGEHIDNFCLLCVAFADNLEFSAEQWNHVENCESCFRIWKHLIDEFRDREVTLN